MTVRELCSRMDSQELTEWIAYTKYFQALPDPWEQTGLLVSSILAPYSREGAVPKPSDFVPLVKPPSHPEQDFAALMKLKAALGDG